MGKSIGGVLSVFKGKVGPVVGYKIADAKNPQGLRVYNGDVKNPKTTAQNFQRAVFATATVAGVNFKELVNHSFEGCNNGTDSVREFVRANVTALRAAGVQNINLLIKGNKSSVVAPYMMSRGSLGETNIVVVDGVNTLNGIKLPAAITVGEGDDAVTGWSLAQLRAVIPALQAGAEICFYCLAVDPEQTAASFNGEDQAVSQLIKERIILSAAAGTMPVILTSEGLLVEGSYDIATTTDAHFLQVAEIGGEKYLIYKGADNSEWGDGLGLAGVPGGVGFIVSTQPEANKYNFTTSRMLPLFAQSGMNAANSYGNVSTGSISVSSDYYLEQPLIDDSSDERNHGDSLDNVISVLSSTKGSKTLKAGQTITLKAVAGTNPQLVIQNFNDEVGIYAKVYNQTKHETILGDRIIAAGSYGRVAWSTWTAGDVYQLTVTMGGVTQNYNFSFSE